MNNDTQRRHFFLGKSKKTSAPTLNQSQGDSKPRLDSLQQRMLKHHFKARQIEATSLTPLSQSLSQFNNSFIRGQEIDSSLKDKRIKKILPEVTGYVKQNVSEVDENQHSSTQQSQPYLQDERLGTSIIANEEKSKRDEIEYLKAMERQVKHLKMLNDCFQITLNQKDQIYKAVVSENIKLKHRIQLLEQQMHAKSLSQDQNLLFKTQKSLLGEPIAPYSSLETLPLNSRGLGLIASPIAGFKPPRLSMNQTSELSEHLMQQNKSSTQQKKLTKILAPTNLRQKSPQKKGIPTEEDRKSKRERTDTLAHFDESNHGLGDTGNSAANLFRQSPVFQVIEPDGKIKLISDLDNSNQVSNLEESNGPTLDDEQQLTIEQIGMGNHLSVFQRIKHSSSGMSGGLTVQNSFEQLPEESSQTEIKSMFVSHSTDFGFITQLLDIKSKSADNLKLYQENKWVSQTRSVLSSVRQLKRTIMNLSKSSFNQFYESLQKTLESSDMFFHLTNKLKSLVSAIIKIHLQVESTQAFSLIVKETCSVLNCDRASVYLVNPTSQELWTKVAKGAGVIKVPFGQGLVGYVANSLKPLNILDAHKDSRFNAEIDRKNNYHTKSVLCMPVIDTEKGVLLGVVQAINKLDGFFTKDDEGCLQIMAVHAMNVLRNSISHDENQKSQSMVKNLLEISIKLSKHITVEKLLPKATAMISQYLDVPEVKFYLLDSSTKKIFYYSPIGEKIEFSRDCGLIGYTMQTGTDQNIDNAYNHINFNKLVDIDTSMPLSVYLVWDNPIKKTRLLGALEIINFNGINNISLSKGQKSSYKFDKQVKTFCEIVGAKLKQIMNQQNSSD